MNEDGEHGNPPSRPEVPLLSSVAVFRPPANDTKLIRVTALCASRVIPTVFHRTTIASIRAAVLLVGQGDGIMASGRRDERRFALSVVGILRDTDSDLST